MRILVVEDEWLLAADLALRLGREGFDVVGPAGTVREARELVDANGADAAILDVQLDGETSFALASHLDAIGVPIIFLTGHSPADFPELRSGRTVLSKPADWQALIGTLQKLLV